MNPQRIRGTESFGFLWMLADDRNVLSWGEVEARNPVVVGLDV